MANVVIDVEIDDINENSLDTSGDGEYMSMVDEGCFDASGEKSQIVSQSFLDSNDNSSYHFKEITGVTYKLIPMTGEESGTTVSKSPTHDTSYYVISNPVEVFGTTPPKKAVPRDPLKGKAVTTKKRDDKRRASHNEVERRRRDKINTWISNLAKLVPNSGLTDTASKGGILAKACDYINELTRKQKKLEKMEVENEKLVREILRLNQELSEVRKENASMRNQLADNCIVSSQKTKGQKS